MTPAGTSALDAVLASPRLKRSPLGICVVRLRDGARIYERAPDMLVQAASTTKIVTCIAAIEALGPDFRFSTVVRASATIGADGTVEGNLILVASGDPNLSGRVTHDDRLAFTDADHAGPPWPSAAVVDGSPTLVLDALARDVFLAGVRRVRGRVLVDTSIFPDQGVEAGTGIAVSAIAVNDNVIDVFATAGEHEGDRAQLRSVPAGGGYTLVNEVVTGETGSRPAVTFVAAPDSRVIVSGTTPPGRTQLYRYPVPDPQHFAATLFVAALQRAGVLIGFSDAFSASDSGGPIVAEHRSPPLTEAVKVILKVSQNMAAEMLPAVVGAHACDVRGAAAADAGFARERAALIALGADESAAAQADACGINGWFTPSFMCALLARVWDRPYFTRLRDALPVLGRDGTLASTQATAPSAGKVWAKTGTLVQNDRLNAGLMLTTKALAGYITAKSGDEFAFAIYANNVAIANVDDVAAIGELLGRAATALWEHL